MKNVFAAAAFALVALSAAGQQQKSEQAQAAATVVIPIGDPANPSLVPSVSADANDSALVKAAKATVARRKKQTQPSLRLQNKDLVPAKGKLTEPHQPPAPIYYTPESKPQPTGATVRIAESRAEEQKAADEAKAKKEQAARRNLNAEAEEPYGDEKSKDEDGARDTTAQKTAPQGPPAAPAVHQPKKP